MPRRNLNARPSQRRTAVQAMNRTAEKDRARARRATNAAHSPARKSANN